METHPPDFLLPVPRLEAQIPPISRIFQEVYSVCRKFFPFVRKVGCRARLTRLFWCAVRTLHICLEKLFGGAGILPVHCTGWKPVLPKQRRVRTAHHPGGPGRPPHRLFMSSGGPKVHERLRKAGLSSGAQRRISYLIVVTRFFGRGASSEIKKWGLSQSQLGIRPEVIGIDLPPNFML